MPARVERIVDDVVSMAASLDKGVTPCQKASLVGKMICFPNLGRLGGAS